MADLEKEANDRLREARHRKELRVLDLKECYFLGAPNRQRQISSQTQPSMQTMLDAPELYTDLGYLLVDDFATELINTYMPEAQIWCERKAGELVKAEDFAQVSEQVRKDDRKIFDTIKSSNFYAELAKCIKPDLAIGTAAIHIDRPKPGQPIQCLAVPIRELEINLGPDGEIDDRFIVRFTRNCYVRKLIGEKAWANISQDLKQKVDADPAHRTELRWGYWRLWDDNADEAWQHVVMVKDKLVDQAVIKGEGCCPLIVMRFDPDADWPWANGPMIKGLPTLRQVDEWERQIPEAVERATNSAITFPDDSFTNVEQGIEPGMAYPVRPGSEGAVKQIYQQPSIDPELVDLERKEHRLRKLFFVDHPEQTGDTPPTLGQWLDELARMQRRIGTAGYSFWREGPMKIFLRYKYLLEASGVLAPIKSNGRTIATVPYNPTQRAAEQQEIATAVQCLQISLQTFPEEGRLQIDGGKTISNFIDKMRTGGLVALRPDNQIKQVLPMIAQLIQGRQRAGEAAPSGEAGAPGPV